LSESGKGGAMDDVLEIKALIKRQFASLSWPDGGTGNWQAFSNDFLDGAALYPATRPIHPQSVADFLTRMKSIAGKELRSLEEGLLGTNAIVFLATSQLRLLSAQ
jgi:hypothetical protein